MKKLDSKREQRMDIQLRIEHKKPLEDKQEKI
jgi:hypothetical protein